MIEQQQQKSRKAPAPTRIWKSTPRVLVAVEKLGSAYTDELFLAVENIEKSVLVQTLWRLQKYGLVSKNADNLFALTNLGIEYCKILPGRKREGKPKVEAEGLTGWPAPHEELTARAAPLSTATTTPAHFPTSAQLGQIQAQTEHRSSDQIVNRSYIDLTSISYGQQIEALSELERRFLDEIPNDPLPSRSRPYESAGSGSASTKIFKGFSVGEKAIVHNALKEWRKSAQPSEDEFQIVEQMILVCCEDPADPWNQHIFSRGREEAARFFDLSFDAFNLAISRLKKRRSAYFYDGQFEKKVGIYLPWLDLLKTGRF